MSRTSRKHLNGNGRDGKHDFMTLIARDDRVTGLRDHRRDRRTARESLRRGEDKILSGKHRRYSNRHGAYRY